MAIKRNDITIGISGSDLEKFQEQQMNDFQEKRITWQGEDNVLVTTVLQRLYEFAAGKVQIILADTMPSSTEPNTQYWVKTYSGTTLEDGRFVIMTDTLNNATFIGKSSADLTEFYTKAEIDAKLTDLATSNFRDGVVLTTLGNSDNAKTLVSGQAARVALGNKQDKITASDQLTTPTDSDKLSYLNNVTNNRWTFGKIWDWITSKLTPLLDTKLSLSGGTMTGSITTKAETGIKRDVDNSRLVLYGSTGYNKGAYLTLNGINRTSQPGQLVLNTTDGTTNKALIANPNGKLTWDSKQVATMEADKTGDNALVITNGKGLSGGVDYASNVIRRISVMGKMVFFTCHLKYSSVATSAGWTEIGTVPAGLRPANRTSVVAQVYNNSLNESAGGNINTTGIITIWTNAKVASSNYQVRVSACWRLPD